MPRLVFALMVIAALGVSPAHSQSIDIVLHPDSPGCTAAEVGANPWIELHVVANLGGNVEGFQGAQFKVTGMPASWNEENVSWVWDASAALSFGNPLFAGDDGSVPGAVVAWSACRAGVHGVQRIGKILLLGAPTAENTTLEVKPYQLHSGEDYCAKMNQCNDPIYTSDCVGAGSFTLNGPGSWVCTVSAVEEQTWTVVKSFYQ